MPEVYNCKNITFFSISGFQPMRFGKNYGYNDSNEADFRHLFCFMKVCSRIAIIGKQQLSEDNFKERVFLKLYLQLPSK